MSKVFTTPLGNVEISNEVICAIAGYAATSCYGLVGMASRTLQDGIAELLGKDSLSKGIELDLEDNAIKLRLFIIVEYGINITEVAKNVCDTVKFKVEESTGMKVESVNIIVQGVHVAPAGKELTK